MIDGFRVTGREPGSKRTRGVVAALAAAALFGGATPFIRPTLSRTSAVAAAGYLYLGQAVVLSAAWMIGRLRASRTEADLAGSDLSRLIVGIVAGGLVAPGAFMAGLALAPAYRVSILLGLEVVFTLLIALVFRHERLGRRAWTGVGFLLAAGLLAAVAAGAPAEPSSPPTVSSTSLIGLLFVVLACLAWAVDNNATAGIAGKDPTAIALLKGWAAAVTYLGGSLLVGRSIAAGPGDLGILLVAGAVGYGVALRLFIVSMRHLGAGLTAALFSTAPIAGFAASVGFLRERPGVWGWCAFFLAGVGVAVVSLGRHDHLHDHEETTHEHAHEHDDHHDHEHPSGTEDREGSRPGHRHTHPHTHRKVTHGHPHDADLHHAHRH